MDERGEFVVVWQSSQFSEETGAYGHHPRVLIISTAADSTVPGGRAGPRFELSSNSGYGSTALRPAVAMNPGGAFVVVWYAAAEPHGLDVRAQRFDSSGRPLGQPLRANDTSLPPLLAARRRRWRRTAPSWSCGITRRPDALQPRGLGRALLRRRRPHRK